MTSRDPRDQAADRADVWSRYWASLPTDGSQAGSFADGYAGTAIETWWRDGMTELANRRSWLDIATGSGALPQIWLQTIDDAQARCAAVDMAQIHAPWLAHHDAASVQRIAWHSFTRAEALPAADDSVDVVMSQYGFEYADREPAVTEMARVLAPGGALRLVMHHAQGRPALLAKAEVEHIDDLTGPAGLWSLACRLIEPVARSATAAGRAALAADAVADALRDRFNAEHDRMQGVARRSLCPDVLDETFDAIAALFQRAVAQGETHAQALASRWSQHLRDSRLRLVELQACALAEGDADALRQMLGRWFHDIRFGSLTDQGHLMAWTLRATRGT